MKKSTKICLSSAGLFCCIIGSTASACPSGKYDVTGWNPGHVTTDKPDYTGTVEIKSVGKVCQLDWKIANQLFGGVGFYDAETGNLDVGYANLQQGWFGQVSYRRDGDNLRGEWAIYGESKGAIGIEILSKAVK